ncbi:MAG: hypothetical protein ACRD8Z_00420 [Nitrososphaeraceae archaeon]
MEWTKECTCNAGKPSFEAIEFNSNNSRMEIVCGKCHGTICWRSINTDQISTPDENKTKEKSLTVPTRKR